MTPSLAKINLGLRILGKRSDGFHQIETIYQTISVKDELNFELQTKNIQFICNSLWCPTDATNLVVKAANLLHFKYNVDKGCQIHLVKNIPSGAGLGGGSSNAAITLLTLNDMWETGLTTDELAGLAAELGSDVPFFIYGGTALGTSRGEILTPLNMNAIYWGCLVCPGIHISTPWAYKQLNFNLTNTYKNSKFGVLTSRAPDLSDWQDLLVNDFECIVFPAYPELEIIHNQLQKMGAFYARMSGSGSSIFGLFATKQSAQAACVRFKQQHEHTFLFEPVY